MRIIISAGGTGGHIYPALSIIEGFKKYDKSLEVLYIGTKNRMEKDIIPKENIPYYGIEIYGLSKNILKDIKDIFLILKAKKAIKKKIAEFKPDVVLGIGGYVTYPVLMAAKSTHIKTFIHEQNAIPGKTNKMISKYADIIGVSFPESAKYFPNQKVIYTGNPTGIRALNTPKITKTSLGLKESLPLVVVVCGSLGSATVNAAMQGYLKKLGQAKYQVVYITGKSLYEEFTQTEYPKNVLVLPYLDNLSGLLKETDILVARAGASTIAEIKALNLPSILIPSPYVANNHQYYNAKALEDNGEAIMLEEHNLNIKNIHSTIENLLTNKEKYQTIKNNLQKESTLDSTNIIYDAVKDLIKK